MTNFEKITLHQIFPNILILENNIGNNKGSNLFIKSKYTCAISIIPNLTPGLICGATLHCFGSPLTICSVYSPHDINTRKLLEIDIQKIINSNPICIFMGDFNTVFEEMDWTGHTTPPKWPWLKSQIGNNILYDPYRKLYPDVPGHTRFGTKTSARLDMFLATPLCNNIFNFKIIEILSPAPSDHHPIKAEISVNKIFSPPPPLIHEFIKVRKFNANEEENYKKIILQKCPSIAIDAIERLVYHQYGHPNLNFTSNPPLFGHTDLGTTQTTPPPQKKNKKSLCPRCTLENYFNKCELCYYPDPPFIGNYLVREDIGPWSCKVCSLINPVHNLNCSICLNTRTNDTNPIPLKNFDNTALDMIIFETNKITNLLSNTARTILNQFPHPHKEKEWRILNLLNNIDDSLDHCNSSLIKKISDDIFIKKKNKLIKSVLHGGNLKNTWNEFNEPLPSIPLSLKKSDGTYTKSLEESLSTISNCFYSLGKDLQPSLKDPQILLNNILKGPEMSIDPPSYTQFCDIVKNCKPTKACGLDNLNGYLISIAPDIIKINLWKLLTLTWKIGFPNDWKRAKVILIPKTAQPTKAEDFRPITLLNCLIKIATTHIHQSISDHLLKNNILKGNQCGFTKGLGTDSLLWSLSATQCKSKNSKILLLDINKAFNSVPHNFLWDCLSHIGLNSSSLSLLKNIYSNMISTPYFFSYKCPQFFENRGVRQGCPLSPTLFNIFFNLVLANLEKFIQDNNFNTKIFSFADDVALFSESEIELNILLNKFNSLCSMVGLKLNVKKCSYHLLKPDQTASGISTFDGTTLPPQNTPCKYLGVYLGQNSESFTLTFFKEIITNFITKLTSLDLPYRISISLLNQVLYPKLIYKLQTHSLDFVLKCQKLYWELASKSLKLPLYTHPNIVAGLVTDGGLGLYSLSTGTSINTCNFLQKKLHNIDPPHFPDWDFYNNTLIKMANNINLVQGCHMYQPKINTPPPPPSLPSTFTIQQLKTNISKIVPPMCKHNINVPLNNIYCYTDGSYFKKYCKGGCSAVFLYPNRTIDIYTTSTHPVSAFFSEIKAIILAINCAPPDMALTIFSDSVYALTLFDKLKTLSRPEIFWSKSYSLVSDFYYAIHNSKSNITLKKIKSHSQNFGNDLAHTFAIWGTHLPLNRSRSPSWALTSIINFGSPIDKINYKIISKNFSKPGRANHLSFKWLQNDRHKSTIFFKWAHNLILFPPLKDPRSLSILNCPICKNMHTLSFFGCLAQCIAMENFRENFFKTWDIGYNYVRSYFHSSPLLEKIYILRGVITDKFLSELPDSLNKPSVFNNHKNKFTTFILDTLHHHPFSNPHFSSLPLSSPFTSSSTINSQSNCNKRKVCVLDHVQSTNKKIRSLVNTYFPFSTI